MQMLLVDLYIRVNNDVELPVHLSWKREMRHFIVRQTQIYTSASLFTVN